MHEIWIKDLRHWAEVVAQLLWLSWQSGLQFESSHILNISLLKTVLRRQKLRKEAGNGPILRFDARFE